MDEEELLEHFEAIKKQQDIDEIGIFDEDGYILHTTQEEDFQAHHRYYGLPAGATKLISESHQQECEGIILELENTEFFMRFLRYDSEDLLAEEEKEIIISIEYRPQSLKRDELKSITEKINDLIIGSKYLFEA